MKPLAINLFSIGTWKADAWRTGAGLVAAVVLAGCAAQQPVSSGAVLTKPVLTNAEARKIILAERSRLWKDPESIRDASIGDTYPCSSPKFAPTGAMVDEPGSCTCVELNARNSYGGYVGIRRTIVVALEAGGTTTLDGGTKGYEAHCQGLTPFSELNGNFSRAKPR